MSGNEKMERLVSRGAELTGATVGGVVGFFAGGPIGAAIGGASGPLITWSLQKVGREFSNRWLSPREEVRVGAGLVFVYNKISKYIEEGYEPRSDGFFEQDISNRSSSDEILEGVLLKCKNEHEEKKLKFISNIYANVAFMPDISVFGANWLLQKAQELTYRQMCILALIEQCKDFSIGASWGPNDGDPAFEMEYKQLTDMLAFRESLEDYYRGHYDISGNQSPIVGLSRTGEFLYKVMGLKDIPEDDLKKLAPNFPRAFLQIG